MMCQISHCIHAAKHAGRELIIDTNFAADWGNCFRQPFDELFRAKKGMAPTIHPRLSPRLLIKLRRLDTYPFAFQGMPDMSYALGQHGSELEEQAKALVLSPSRVEWKCPLIVYQNFGGGNQSIDALKWFTFSPLTARAIGHRLSQLPPKYQAIHVRNTDRATNYRPFFKRIRPYLFAQNVLLCSDDAECIEYGRNFFDKSNVITLVDTPALDTPLHHAVKNRRNLNQDMLTDLMGLAGASKMYFTNSPNPLCTDSVSGFTRLALALHKQPQLRKQLLHEKT